MKKTYYSDRRTRVTDEVVADEVSRLIIPLQSVISVKVTRLFPFWRSRIDVVTSDGRSHILRSGVFCMNVLRDIEDALCDALNDILERERSLGALEGEAVRRARVGERLKESGETPPPEVMEMFEKK